MPIFEYRCEVCRGEFEAIVLSADASNAVRCRHCDSSRITRLLSSFAVSSSSAGASPAPTRAMSGGCGRCGDPQGPCGAAE